MFATPVYQPESPAVEAATADTVLQKIASQGFIQFHPALGDRLGYKAALFLGHALYWSRHLARTQPRRNGWFFMTARQWQQATGLTTREQASVRELLVNQGLLHERMAGRPARLYFRVDLSQLTQWVGLDADVDGSSTISWEAFSPWLRGSVSFYRPLVDVAGSVASALYLSYLLQLQRADVRLGQSVDGFFPVSQEDVRIALCLGVKTQRNARDKLKSSGLLHERHGLARVDLQELAVALGQIRSQVEQPSKAVEPLAVAAAASTHQAAAMPIERWLGAQSITNAKPQSTFCTHHAQLALFSQPADDAQAVDSAIGTTMRMFAPGADLAHRLQEPAVGVSVDACQRFALLSKLGPQVAQNANPPCPFVETDLPFCRTHIQKESINTTTTTRVRKSEPQSRIDKKASRRRSFEISDMDSLDAKASARSPSKAMLSREVPELVLPAGLSSDWHPALLCTVTAAPKAIRQALLDELEGLLGVAGKTIANPPGYLHALIRRHAKGELVLAMADKVAAARDERQRVQAAVQRAINGAGAGTATTPTNAAPAATADSPVARQARERLMELRKQFAVGGGR